MLTNFEKYKDQILKITNNNDVFAFDGRKLHCCEDYECDDCVFRTFQLNCRCERIKWMYEEYHEPTPKLTKAERDFCMTIDEDGYIARDEDGRIFLYDKLPEKGENRHLCTGNLMRISPDAFSFIQWDDEKPWSIEDLLKLEVEE